MEIEVNTPAASVDTELSTLIVPLLKGIIYKENDSAQWSALLDLKPRIRDYLAVIGLRLALDEAEGYAFLHSANEDFEESPNLPRLVARRPLSFPVSLLLALLRKKMAEFDASSGDIRLVVSRAEIVDLIRLFLPDSSNETKLIDQVDTHLKKIIDLGFVRRLKPTSVGQEPMFEVRRILKAFVDTQWLSDFSARLDTYRTHKLALSGASTDE